MLWIFLGVLLLLFILYLVLQNSAVQTYLTNHISKEFSKVTHSEILVEKVAVSPFGKITLNEIFLSDTENDTLFYAEKLKAQIEKINFKKKKISFSKLSFEKPYFKLISSSDTTLNLFSVLDPIEEKDTADVNKNEPGWQIAFDRSEIKNGRFVYLSYDRKKQNSGMNYEDLDFYNINTQISNFRNRGDTVFMHFDAFSCMEKCGLDVKKLSSDFRVSGTELKFTDTRIQTPKSNLIAEHLIFKFVSGQQYWRNFTRKVRIDYKILPESHTDFRELALFNPVFLNYRGDGKISGRLTGTIKSLRCKNVVIKTFSHSEVYGDFYFNGLPYIDETYVDARLKKLITVPDDLEKIYLPNFKNHYVTIPESVDKLGLIHYKGNFTGFLEDFVFYGKAKTALGDFHLDLSLKPTVISSLIGFRGDLKTANFNAGKFLNNPHVGEINANLKLSGITGKFQNIDADLSGTINNLKYYDYDYENISVNAKLNDSKFDGELAMDDENVKLNFEGLIDFSKEIPAMKFKSDIKHARLFALKLHNDEKAVVSTQIFANIEGGKIDDAEGQLILKNLSYTNKKGNIFLKELNLFSKTNKQKRVITLRSDVADAEMEGDFEIMQISGLLNQIMDVYLPKSTFAHRNNSLLSKKIKFDMAFKKTKKLYTVFLPDFSFDDNTRINFNYEQGRFNGKISSKYLSYMGRNFSNFLLTGSGDNEKAVIDIRANKFNFNDKINLNKFSVSSSIMDNRMATVAKWDNSDIQQKGEIHTLTHFGTNTIYGNRTLNIVFEPQRFYIDGNQWEIGRSNIDIDGNYFNVNSFKIGQNDNFFEIEGIVSNDKKDILSLNFRNTSLVSIANLLGLTLTDVQGALDGAVHISDFYNKRITNADVKVKNIILNGQMLGNANIISTWDRSKQALTFSSSIQDMLIMEGYYIPSQDKIDVKLELNDANFKLLEPYIHDFAYNPAGNISGNLKVSGKLNKATLNGLLRFKNAGLRLAQTQTDYSLNDEINIVNNIVLFENFKIKDKNDNNAVMNGQIDLKNIQDPLVDINLQTENFNVLNSQANEFVYGNANVSGNIKFLGNADNLDMRAKIATEADSKIGISLGGTTEAYTNDFMTFVNPYDTIPEKPVEQFQKTKKTSTYSYNYELSIPPETEIELNFASQAGNVLKARGTGDLVFSSNGNDELVISGEYTIERGQYIFSFLNVVNKKFELEKGGVIKWNGNPYDAYLDMNAVYKVRTSISNLVENQPVNIETKTMVHCVLNLSDRLENPLLKFSIEFPNLDPQTVNLLKAAFPTEEEVNKQALSLLILNRFYTPDYFEDAGNNATGQEAIGVTASEFVSNQLSRLVSRLSDNVDVGFIYRPGDELSSEEVGLALSTQLLNDRVSVSSNISWESNNNTQKSNEFTGDLDVNVKIDKRGKLRFKAFTREDDNLYYYENRRNTQGVGILYREEFDSFKELVTKYVGFFGKKKKNNN